MCQRLDVVADIFMVQNILLGLETGQRGFVITGEQDFLRPYTSGLETINTLIGDARRRLHLLRMERRRLYGREQLRRLTP